MDTGEVVSYTTPFFKTPYNHNTDAESLRTGQVNDEPTKTQQHQAADTDINKIVRDFGITGKLPEIKMPPTYAEFADIFDFQSAMNTIKDATDSFAQLPANIRARFNNDPAHFVGYVDYCLENGDIDPLREMGLAVKAKATTPPDTPASSPGTPKAEEAPKASKTAPSGAKGEQDKPVT